MNIKIILFTLKTFLIYEMSQFIYVKRSTWAMQGIFLALLFLSAFQHLLKK